MRYKTLTTSLLLTLSLSTASLAQTGSDAEFEQRIRNYILDNPAVIVEAIQRWQQQQQEAEAQQYQATLARLHDDLYNNPTTPILGNPNGDVAVIEFVDYNCGYCRRAFNDLLALADGDGQVKILMKEFPILGEGSLFASRAALAAQKQGGYEALHTALMRASGQVNERQVLALAREAGLNVRQLQQDMQDPSIDAILQSNQALARQLGINGTPGFIIGEEIVRGAVGLAQLQRLVNAARSSGS